MHFCSLISPEIYIEIAAWDQEIYVDIGYVSRHYLFGCVHYPGVYSSLRLSFLLSKARRIVFFFSHDVVWLVQYLKQCEIG